MSSHRFQFVGGSALLVAVVVAYLGVFWNDFVEFDDSIYVVYNTHTAEGLSLAGFRYAFTTFESGNWIPLTWLSFQLDATLFGMGPIGFHATNLLLHLANVLLLFTWLIRVTGFRQCSWVTAVIFGLHPLHVESVAWVAERKDVLSTFWMLIALHCYERNALGYSKRWYLATCLMFAFGLLSKSMLVTFPCLLLLADVWLLNRISAFESITGLATQYPVSTLRRLILEKIPLFGLSLLAGVMTIAAASQSTAFTQINGRPLIQRLYSAIDGYGWYIEKTFHPTDLMVLYPHPENELLLARCATTSLVLIGITIYTIVFGRRRTYLFFGWTWYLVSLLPVIGLFQFGSQAYADRYSYVPHIGLLLAIVLECHLWLSRLPGSRGVSILLVSAVTVVLGWQTTRQVAVWRTTETLWSHAIVIDPDNMFARSALGNCYLESGQLEDAIKQFQLVVKRYPRTRESYERLVDIYRRHLKGELNQSSFRNELGLYYASERKIESARIRFAQAIAISPDNIFARNNLAISLMQLGRDQEARTQFKKVLSMDPGNGNAHTNLGALLEKAGEIGEARDHFAAAHRLNSNDEESFRRLQSIDKARSKPAP